MFGYFQVTKLNCVISATYAAILALAAAEDASALQNPESFLICAAGGNNWIWQRVLRHQNAADQNPKYFYPHAVECSSKLESRFE